MKIKVCGIKYANDIQSVIDLGVDYIGLNFCSLSPRFFQDSIPFITKEHCKIVGLFVNEKIETVKWIVESHSLDVVQLHGNEDAEYCKSLLSFVEIWKAIPHSEITNNDLLLSYSMCSKLLFDTAGVKFGGTGQKFDWNELQKYTLSIPYFLAGGIDLNDTSEILKLEKSKGFYGVDINSKFEINPGKKDINKIKKFIKKIRK